MSYFPSGHSKRRYSPTNAWESYLLRESTTPHSLSYSNQSTPSSDWCAMGTLSYDPYSSSQPMAWTAEPPRSTALDSLLTPTQALLGSGYTTETTLALSHPWSSQHGLPYLPSLYAPNPEYHNALDASYSHLLPMTTTNACEALRLISTSWPKLCDTTPDHSEASASSQTSMVGSSPYAHSNSCYQPSTPPSIKKEDSSDPVRYRFHSIPGLPSWNRHSHVNPGDVYNSSTLSAAQDKSITPVFTPVKTEEEDAKLQIRIPRPVKRRAVSLEDRCRASPGIRAKRSFTTAADSRCHCERCGKLFRRSYNLRVHMETHQLHREQPYECPWAECKRRFVRRTDLTRHEQSVHLKLRLYSCPRCHSSFARKDTLGRHVDDGCPRNPKMRRVRNSIRNAVDASSSRLHSSRDASEPLLVMRYEQE